ncbi:MULTISPECIES: SURF1 family protein [unclassified Brevibacterium]|uniref:SURF1 family cytochrome oxidase biogenesis protein n=1 Tax=unclassified Brevibacterium TaxID=2614124 RepID=UPI001091C153|nr:SURF1 family protein [Brevibacterium sp. S22]TGD32320.1 SURF1 family protein [Brevibacterium sp. S22]
MSRYSFLFSARWLKYIAMAIIVIIACVFLALWQKDRRDQREQEIATITANYSADPVDISSVLPKPKSTLATTDEWTQVELSGRYSDEDTVLARNRTVEDTPGFYVVTPFEVTGGSTIAVVRGFTAEQDSVPPAPQGEQTVVTHLRPAQDGSDDENPQGLIRAIDPARIPGMADGYSNVYVEASPEETGGASEEGLTPLPMPELDPGNHLSYMLQWFAFGIMIIIAVVISARRERKASAEVVERSDADSGMVVIDKAALDAGAKISSQPGSRYGRNRWASPTVRGHDEAEEDALFEERFRSQ